MRRKLVATLLVGAIAVTGAVGFTACKKDGVSLSKGVQVTAEEWTKAFEDTVNATNYTAEMYSKYAEEGSANVDGVAKNFSSESVQTGTLYYDGENKMYYSDAHVKGFSKGYKDAYPEYDVEDEELDYDVKNFYVEEIDKVYSVSYNGNEENPKWVASMTYQFPTSMIGYYLSSSYATELGGERVTLSKLYESFTYSGGYYTATLYTYDSEFTVTVSIKDGYVVGYQREGSDSYEEDGDSSAATEKLTVNISNIGSTTVNAPSEAVAAFNEFKAN